MADYPRFVAADGRPTEECIHDSHRPRWQRVDFDREGVLWHCPACQEFRPESQFFKADVSAIPFVFGDDDDE